MKNDFTIWKSYIILLIGIFVTLEAANFVGVVTPAMTAYYGLDVKNASIFSIAYYMTGIALAPLFGRMGDRVGRKKLVIIGLVIFALSEFVAGMIPPLSIMILARVIQGVGYALIFANVLAYIPEMFEENKRGKAIGIFTLFTYVATGTGGIIAGVLLDSFGWNSIFIVSGSLAALGAILVTFFVPNTKPLASKVKQKIDFSGAALIMLFIGTFVSIPLLAGNFGYGSVYTLTALIVALLVLLAIIFVEKKAHSPILDIAVLKIKGIQASAMLITGTHIVLLATVSVLTFFAASRAGITGVSLGLIPTVNFAIGIIVGPIVGYFLDRYRPFYIILIALFTGTIGVTLFSFINSETTLSYLLIVMAFMGAFASSLNATLMKIVVDESPQEKKGVGTGTFALFKDFGFPLGSSIGLAIYGVFKSSGSTSGVREQVVSQGGTQQEAELVANAVLSNNVTAEAQAILTNLNLEVTELLAVADFNGIDSAINAIAILNITVISVLFIITFILLKKQRKKQTVSQSQDPAIKI